MSYTLIRKRGKVESIKRNADGASIPVASGNRDYQDFLAWNALQEPPLDLSDTSPTQAEQDEDADHAQGVTDKQTLKSQATQAIADINSYLAIADSATNVQVRDEVKKIDQRQRAIIKALVRLF